MDAKTLLEYAYQLSDTESPSECCMRTAAGRAYYAAYHALLPISEQCDPLPPNKRRGGVHMQTFARLKQGSERFTAAENKELKKLAMVVRSMKAIRTMADYKLAETFSELDRDEVISRADEVLKRIEKITV